MYHETAEEMYMPVENDNIRAIMRRMKVLAIDEVSMCNDFMFHRVDNEPPMGPTSV